MKNIYYLIILLLALTTLWTTPYLWNEFFKDTIYKVPFAITVGILFFTYLCIFVSVMEKYRYSDNS